MQSPKPLAFLPPSKRQKAPKEKAAKKKGSTEPKPKEGKSSKGSKASPEAKAEKGKGKADELGELFDHSKFDLLQALENVDRFRAEGPEADNVAHMKTLAMLSAATGGALNSTNYAGQKEANTTENVEVNTSGETGDKRKMHSSFNTTTTDKSFGHLYHRDGHPVPPPNGGPSGRFSHHRHHSSGGALADISEATESRDAKHHAATVEDVPDVSLEGELRS